MPLPDKPGPALALKFGGKFPDMPKLPPEMIRRFPELADYQGALDSWWARIGDMLQSDRGQVQVNFTTLQTQIAKILPN